jgi:hypothetical protein
MNRKAWWMTALLLVLGGWYLYGFTDWFAKRAIQVDVTYRPIRQSEPNTAIPVVFGLDQDYSLTALAVTQVGANTNQPAKTVWRLVSNGKAPPTRGFLYGDIPDGMALAPGTAAALPLEVGASYRVDVVAGRVSGHLEFIAKASE